MTETADCPVRISGHDRRRRVTLYEPDNRTIVTWTRIKPGETDEEAVVRFHALLMKQPAFVNIVSGANDETPLELGDLDL